METFDTVFSVDGKRYALRLSRFPPNGWAIGCGSADGARAHDVLCAVAGDAWFDGPKKFVDYLEHKTGWDHDGLHSFAYPHENPEEGRTTVEVRASERIEQEDEDFFRRFMAEFGLACLDAAKHFGDPDAWEGLRPRLEAVRVAVGGKTGLLEAEEPARAGETGLREGEDFAAEGKWNEALALADLALARPQSPARAWALKGRALTGLRRLDEAKSLLDEAVRRHPGRAGVHFALGECRERAGDEGAALDSYDEALRLSPGDLPALSARAALRLRRKDEAGALEDLETMLKVLPAGAERDALLKEALTLRGRE